MRIATIGPKGSFAHFVAKKIPESSMQLTQAIEDVYDLLEHDIADLAILPFQDAFHGLFFQTLEGLKDHHYKIVGQSFVALEYHLASFASLDKIEKLFVYPKSHELCRRSLGEYLTKHPTRSHFEMITENSDANCAEAVLKNKETSAALLSEPMASTYQIPLMKKNLEDYAHQFRRFVKIGFKIPEKTGWDQTSFLLESLDPKDFSFKKALAFLMQSSLNLINIKSYNHLKSPSNPYLFVECEGHLEDELVQKALQDIQSYAPMHFLGSYPKRPLSLYDQKRAHSKNIENIGR